MKKLYPIFALLLVMAMVISACAPVAPSGGDTTAAPAPAGAIKLGFMGPLTGGAAFLGQEQLGYTKAVLDAFNERTGMNVQLVETDSELNADTAKTLSERLVADPEVMVVIGPAGSQECEATKPVYLKGGLAQITQSCTRTDLTSAENATATFFRPIPVDDDQAKTDADYMLTKLSAKNVFLVDDQSSYSTGLNDALAALLEAGGATVGRASVTQQDTDFSGTATSAIAAGAEVVFFSAQLAPQLATLSVQLKEQGFAGTYFLADGGTDLTWIATAGDAAEGTFVSVFSPDPAVVPTMKEYNDRYAAANDGKVGGSFGGASAQATYVAVAALEACKDNMSRQCVVDALKATNLADSPLSTPISFDENGQLAGAKFFLYQVKGGKLELVAN